MIVAGVDPGLYGAVAIYDTDLGTLRVFDMPLREVKTRTGKKQLIDTPAFAAQCWIEMPIDAVAIEEVAARPNQGVSSMFSFGKTAGIPEGAFAALNVPISFYRPQQWQRIVHLAGGEHVKDNARDKAVLLFPGYASFFGRKKDSGRADAALIAYAHSIELLKR